MQDQRYTKIYIYILTHYIYTHVCIHIYTVCVCVYCEIGIIHSKRHATSLVHNYADNHNVPEGNWCAWRDLITYAILCTRIKQKGVEGWVVRWNFHGVIVVVRFGLVWFFWNVHHKSSCVPRFSRGFSSTARSKMYDALFMHLCPFEFLTL